MFVPLNEEQILAKVAACNAYKSQSHRPYFGENYIRSLAHTRGVQIGHYRYAESFEVIRWVYASY